MILILAILHRKLSKCIIKWKWLALCTACDVNCKIMFDDLLHSHKIMQWDLTHHQINNFFASLNFDIISMTINSDNDLLKHSAFSPASDLQYWYKKCMLPLTPHSFQSPLVQLFQGALFPWQWCSQLHTIFHWYNQHVSDNDKFLDDIPLISSSNEVYTVHCILPLTCW